MKEKFKQTCECKNCGNESDMTIHCSLEHEAHNIPKIETKADNNDGTQNTKDQTVCSLCENEANIWLDKIQEGPRDDRK
jgi:hypothetical protein